MDQRVPLPVAGEPAMKLEGQRVFVAGHRGMVGSAIVRRLASEGCEVVTASREELDLTRQSDVEAWFGQHRPTAVFLAAARVGGILANSTNPVDFLHQNLMIGANVIKAAHSAGVEKLLFLGSSCIYPRDSPQPIREESLLTGPLEPTNQWYAIAKIACLKLCQALQSQYGARFVSAMPTNLYGPLDNFDLASGHVLPSLMAKIHAAKKGGLEHIDIWGTGTPRREFMHVDDLADALVHLMKFHETSIPINVGTGSDVSILNLAEQIRSVVGWEGEFRFDRSKPDGTPRKLLDVSRLEALGWRARIGLEDGIRSTYEWYAANVA